MDIKIVSPEFGSGELSNSQVIRSPDKANQNDEQIELSVVSPVYMAEHILPELCRRLDSVLSKMSLSYELILVCDGSPDGSWAVMESLAHEYPRLIVVNLSRNFGQHYALTAGMDLAVGEWTVVMDCDLQDPPEEIPRLVEAAKSGADIVLTRRTDRQHVWIKRKASEWFYLIFGLLSGMKMDSSVGSFRVMHRKVVNAYCSMRESYRMFAGLVDWLGFKTDYIAVKHAERYEGKSSYDFARMLRMASDGIISFSNRPLQISIGLGISLSLISGIYGAYLLVRGLLYGAPSISGWLSTITAVSFIGGLILLNQGILGIYLGRLYNQAKGRPLYVVDKVSMGTKITRIRAGENAE